MGSRQFGVLERRRPACPEIKLDYLTPTWFSVCSIYRGAMHFSIGGLLRQILGIQKRLDKYESRIALLEAEVNGLLNANPNLIHSIVPFLSGGVGNQLFQISCAYALSRKYSYELCLNYDLYASYGQGQHPSKYKDNLYRKIKSCTLNPQYRYSYSQHAYKPIPRLPRLDVKLDGYYQSSKYFSGHLEELRHLFMLPEKDLADAQAFLNSDNRPTVGIHIRLGDYLNHPGLQAYTNSYYLRAVRHFPAETRFVVCSDQPELACEILKSPDPAWWSKRNIAPEVYRGTSELADLAFLCSCKDLILSNSTFSCWAYFLGTQKKTVIAPKQWFNSKVHKENHKDIYEKEWILL